MAFRRIGFRRIGTEPNPVGYCVWNVLQERVYYCTKVDNVVDLKQHIVAEWAALDHSINPSANAQWRLRLHACIRLSFALSKNYDSLDKFLGNLEYF